MGTIREVAEICLYVLMFLGILALTLWAIIPNIIVLCYETKKEKEHKREKELTVCVLENTEDYIKRVAITDIENPKEFNLDFSEITEHEKIKFGDLLRVTVSRDDVSKYEKLNNLAVSKEQHGTIIKENMYNYTVELSDNERVIIEADNTFITGDSVEVSTLSLDILGIGHIVELKEMKRVIREEA